MYFHLILKNVKTSDEEVITERCFAAGAQGVAENLEFRQCDLNYEPETIEKSLHQLNVYFAQPVAEEFLLKIKTDFPEVECAVAQEQDRDWMHEWKKHFKAFPLAGPFWVVPSWLTPPTGAEKVLRIDPGMAFGTGTHATTRMAAQIFLEHYQDEGSVIDVGTGTGILAILAKHLGAEHVVGTDIDEMARQVARENVELNGGGIKISEEQIETIDENFDWVIANIIDGVLLKLQPQLLARLKPGGRLILTGILKEREKEFVQKWQQAGRRPLHFKRFEDDEWVALLCEDIG